MTPALPNGHQDAGAYSVQVLDRAFNILETIAARPARAPEIAARLSLHRATVFRLLANLEARGYVHRTEDGSYRLGRRLLEMSAFAYQSEYPSEIVRPLLRELADRTGETAQFWIREGFEAVCIDQIDSPGEVKLSNRVGRTIPLNTGGVAKILLTWAPDRVVEEFLQKPLGGFTERSIKDREALRAELRRVRERGYAFSDGEVGPASRGIAAPVFNVKGEVNAAVGILAPFDRVTEQNLEVLAGSVVEIGQRISAQLGYSGHRRYFAGAPLAWARSAADASAPSRRS